METWFTEKQTEHFGITARVTKTLHSEKTDFQQLDVVETAEFGNMLLLDGMVMTTEKDEFVYHEMMAHVPLAAHPEPKHVLVVGGGDGGVIREVLKHPSVEAATLVEIDGQVVKYSKKYLPSIAGALEDPRVDVQVADGFMHIAESEAAYDVIMVDSTEPVGPAVKLFEKGFYEGIHRALKEDGIFVAQTDNPWFHADLLRTVYNDVKEIFTHTDVYTANIPTYPSGLWTFTIGSKQYKPKEAYRRRAEALDTHYYTADIHEAAFALPAFVQRGLEREEE